MLSFYYDFLDKYIDRKNFQLMAMDTDSFYMALAAPSIDELIKHDRLVEFNEVKHDWFPRTCCVKHKCFDKRVPGLFKLEYEGERMVCLCSKTYCVENKKAKRKADQVKFSCKGINKRGFSNPIDIYLRVLNSGISESATNIGFRAHQNTIFTYSQQRTGFSYFYVKRKILDDGVSTTYVDL